MWTMNWCLLYVHKHTDKTHLSSSNNRVEGEKTWNFWLLSRKWTNKTQLCYKLYIVLLVNLDLILVWLPMVTVWLLWIPSNSQCSGVARICLMGAMQYALRLPSWGVKGSGAPSPLKNVWIIRCTCMQLGATYVIFWSKIWFSNIYMFKVIKLNRHQREWGEGE